MLEMLEYRKIGFSPNLASEYSSQRYSDEHSTALEMLAEAGIAVRFVSPRLSVREAEET